MLSIHLPFISHKWTCPVCSASLSLIILALKLPMHYLASSQLPLRLSSPRQRQTSRDGVVALLLTSRVNGVKMNILSFFFFLISNCPFILASKFLNTLVQIISSFTCGGKVQRVSKSLRQNGGIAIPILHLYYWAAHVCLLASVLQHSVVQIGRQTS